MTDKPRTTLSGNPPAEGFDEFPGAPQPIDPVTGMHKDYWVLPEEERKKGFVRPYRDKYKHVGIRPASPVRDLTPEEHERYDQFGYVKFEAFGDEGSSVTGRYWTQAQLNSGCGSVTQMGRELSETYARDPKYYGATFCSKCRFHFPVEEFVWTMDGQRVGS